ncbi:antibiotic biosynthesis monooxygenase [Opitutaceae bacterium EW11]|nr:antibiotic biosynthesis monooxygenase [Opitutaceae bacterium EW11]
MSIHVAIIRRVQRGREAEFQEALREFLQASFAHGGVRGANMLTPLPGSDGREFGILRTFANETERDAFYASPLFKTWDKRARALTEGEAVHRQLHGLEAWFRGPGQPPPRWKMAALTFCGVYPLTSVLPAVFTRLLTPWHPLLINIAVTALIVVTLTWVIMPLLTRLTRGWLRAHALTEEPHP